MGFSGFAMAMSDGYDHTALPAIKPLSLCKKLMIFLLSPYLVIRGNLDVARKHNNINLIKKDKPLTGNKKGAFSQDFDLASIKQFCKKNSCSIHDYMGAVLGTSLYEYFDNHKDQTDGQIPNNIDTLVPFSFR